MDQFKKLCKRCVEELPASEFHRNKRTNDGLMNWCKDCRRKDRGAQKRAPAKFQDKRDYFKHRYANTPRDVHASKYRENHLWYKYRIRPADYDKLLAMQDYRCAICMVHISDAPKVDTANRKSRSELSFHVDHDHQCCPPNKSCGECIRSLLCRNCNLGLGFLRDDPARLRAAAEYIERGTLPSNWRTA